MDDLIVERKKKRRADVKSKLQLRKEADEAARKKNREFVAAKEGQECRVPSGAHVTKAWYGNEKTPWVTQNHSPNPNPNLDPNPNPNPNPNPRYGNEKTPWVTQITARDGGGDLVTERVRELLEYSVDGMGPVEASNANFGVYPAKGVKTSKLLIIKFTNRY